MATTWIVAADGWRARVFEVHSMREQLREIEDFANPDAHFGIAVTTDIDTDLAGRIYARGERSPEDSPDPDAQEIERYVGEVRDFLEKAHMEQRFDRLCLIAFPKFLARLRAELSKEVQRTVEEEVPKDLSGFDAQAIDDYVRNKLH